MINNNPQDPLAELITTYNELNSSVIEALHEEPSPLEFMRFVARNTPFVIRGGASNWKATQTWSPAYLSEHLGDEPVNVAVTPLGYVLSNADSPTLYEDGTLVFAKPWEESQPFTEFLNYIIQQEKDPSSLQGEVHYAQTQNDNLRDEYASLFNHVQPDISFARIALQQKSPDAINLWIGNSQSTTALHKDNYENIYVQILGKKHFVLLPPHCRPCVNEKLLRPASYKRVVNDDDDPSPLLLSETTGHVLSKLKLELDKIEEASESGHGENSGLVPFATWDPEDDGPSGDYATPYSKLAQPVKVTLEPGDMLYLPAMWYHKVSQSCNPEEGICVAVNYWYDMEFAGPLYPFSAFVRSVYESQQHK
ncbi:cupin-like domain-containing protein [Rhypophila decipiens]|uniref:Cupin-like domain-containing protein n=1 Tax=Rhypophila decipiens TaxID=261697 RepID=A0AAN6YMI2_9PEZI|nr:cupin-like domain-containing protein [Rhypophila decipiens]